MGPGWATIGRSSVSNGVPAVNGVDEDRLHLSILGSPYCSSPKPGNLTLFALIVGFLATGRPRPDRRIQPPVPGLIRCSNSSRPRVRRLRTDACWQPKGSEAGLGNDRPPGNGLSRLRALSGPGLVRPPFARKCPDLTFSCHKSFVGHAFGRTLSVTAKLTGPFGPDLGGPHLVPGLCQLSAFRCPVRRRSPNSQHGRILDAVGFANLHFTAPRIDARSNGQSPGGGRLEGKSRAPDYSARFAEISSRCLSVATCTTRVSASRLTVI